MFGRFNLADSPAISELLQGLGVAASGVTPRYNITPTEPVPLLRGSELCEARCWLTPSWSSGPCFSALA